MPVPSLPPRTPRDSNALPGRHRPQDVDGGPARAPSNGDPDAALAATARESTRAPAILAEDGRSAVTPLHETREQATWIAEALDQFEVAGTGLARVQKLVGRLRDAAVVALDRGLQPADRAMLQRQVDRVLTEIDTVADETRVDEGLIQSGVPAASASTGRRTPFRAISTGTLGIAGLTVRSSDQAVAASGAVEVATARLDRSANTLNSATARLRETLHGLLNPTPSTAGRETIGSTTVALSTTMLLRAQLTESPHVAAQAQGGLDVPRARWLLDSPPRP